MVLGRKKKIKIRAKLTMFNTEFLSHKIVKQMGQMKQTEDSDSLDMDTCFRIHRMLQYLRILCYSYV